MPSSLSIFHPLIFFFLVGGEFQAESAALKLVSWREKDSERLVSDVKHISINVLQHVGYQSMMPSEGIQAEVLSLQKSDNLVMGVKTDS